MPNKKPKTKPAAKPEAADYVTQSELRSVIELYDIAQDLAIEIRRRIENGAHVRKGELTARLSSGAESVAVARQHRDNCSGTDLMGLDITRRAEAAHA